MVISNALPASAFNSSPSITVEPTSSPVIDLIWSTTPRIKIVVSKSGTTGEHKWTSSLTVIPLPGETEIGGWRALSLIIVRLRPGRDLWYSRTWLAGLVARGKGETVGKAIVGLFSDLGAKLENSEEHPGLTPNRRLARLRSMIEPVLHPELENRLTMLTALKDGWDTYGAPPLSADALREARFTLHEVSKTETPVPAVVPSPDGGVDLEWRLESGVELYIQISPEGNKPFLLVESAESGQEIESEGTIQDPQHLRQLLLALVG